jgi:hypothetical protein
MLLEKPPVAQLLKNLPVFYGTLRFITLFSIALPTGPYPKPDESSPYHAILFLYTSIPPTSRYP